MPNSDQSGNTTTHLHIDVFRKHRRLIRSCQPHEHDQFGLEDKCNQESKSSKTRLNMVYYFCYDAYSQSLSAMTLPNESVDLVLVSDGLCP